ncbi:basic membrane protein A [Hypnocyclicus thermotrophus]|uniref:Basic membrane protein A n=1 Tax=Hypnocyclicus thermotrophus TaxID=1627895 RepID=A0AA46DY13_9FUSO|nr:BMP family ABC transporter substrate-binding protein [Hypnocyclicus thermotrophus]TDT68591.1 basic membrane protein A [Hypnocyclicus thermotrophus]
MKKGLILTILTGLILTFVSVNTYAGLFFGNKKEKADKGLKVGIVLSIGGLGDKSFNDAAYRGLQRAKEELGVDFKYVEPASPAEDEGYLREYAEAGYDLVIATGFLMRDAAEAVAKDFPETKFAIIDDVVDLPNTQSLLFKEDEGSFLVGALAAMMSKTGTIGFVGGMEVPLIKKFQRGYEMGAKYINPDIKIGVLYTSGPNPFNDPVRGKENTLALVKQGADVVYHAAGGTGAGVIAGAKDAGIYAIGVDSNQDGEAPGVVLTSMLKRVDVAVFEAVKALKEGTFKGGIKRFGVAENGVGTTDFEFTKDIIGAEKIAKLEEIKQDIIAGKIKF